MQSGLGKYLFSKMEVRKKGQGQSKNKVQDKAKVRKKRVNKPG